MNRACGLTAENLLRTLPDALRHDENMYALAASVARVLCSRTGEMERLKIYNRIDRLPEPLLDILAHDFKVDWWNTEYTLEEKRRTLKDSWHVHRTLGTKYAVVTAISALCQRAVVQEWWEYGGAPYTFRLGIYVGDEQIAIEKHRQMLGKIQFYKNLRSVLDAIVYSMDIVRLLNGPEKFMFRQLAASFRFINTPGDPPVQLDGQKRLTGDWRLNQAFQGLTFPRLLIISAAAEQNQAAVSYMTLSGQAYRTKEALRLSGTGYAAACCGWQRAGYSQLRISLQMRHKHTISAALTKDTMYLLDGVTELNGTRKLNADIAKEEL